jgi:hypothetical protein
MTADLDETPLDPAQLRLQARLRRLVLISGGTLGLGIFAVLIAIVYRVGMIPAAAVPATAVPGAPVRAAATILPAGARLVGTNVDGNRIVLTYEVNGGTTVITVDPRSLAVTGRLDLKPE